MTPEQFQQVEDLFFALAPLEPQAQDDRLVGVLDPVVVDAVRKMLRADDAELRITKLRAQAVPQVAQSSFEDPVEALRDTPIAGRYRVVDKIGEGGFGVVLRAEQLEPVKRMVAVKVIKPGMDSRAVLARFEAERQALAIMNHDGIARVFDGGVTDNGRPFFVMELVGGRTITEHCDQEQLSLTERLQLFIQVCDAVQHAHSKGVIHRDLKPSNILVEYKDGIAKPKVIDFGIAKALDQQLTEASVFTEQGMLIGTPEYVSPEQAEVGAFDIDTRSDVYSLGVVLYELLSGTRPFPPEELRRQGFAEIQRIIREVEPPRPSARLASDATTTAANRQTQHHTLAAILRRDLDWVVMKCLEKDRERRYATPTELIAELHRFLNNEPVHAGQPSIGYRLTKFARRNSVTVAALSAITAIVFASMGLILMFALQARVDRTKALEAASEAQRQARIADAVRRFLTDDLFGATIPSQDPQRGHTIQVRDLLDMASREIDASGQPGGRFDGEPMIESQINRALGNTYGALGLPGAERRLSRATELAETARPDSLEALTTAIDHAGILATTGRSSQAEASMQHTISRLVALVGQEHRATISARRVLAAALTSMRKLDEAETLVAASLADAERLFGPADRLTLNLLRQEAAIAQARGLDDNVTRLQRTVYDRSAESLGRRDPKTLANGIELSWTLVEFRRYEEAADFMSALLADVREVFGPDHRTTLHLLNNLGGLSNDLGETDKAFQYFSEALAGFERIGGSNDPDALRATNNLALIKDGRGDLEGALRDFQRVHAGMQRQFGPDHELTLKASINIARQHIKLDQLSEAAAVLEDVAERTRRVFGSEHPMLVNSLPQIVWLNRKLNQMPTARAAAEECYEISKTRFGADNSRTLGFAQMVSDVYEQWHALEPDKGHDEQMRIWRDRAANAGD